jgi:murein DD-endopeptidase MepM/ murein hydrolase activator NlpD
VVNEGEDVVPSDPAYGSRRERREAERAAETLALAATIQAALPLPAEPVPASSTATIPASREVAVVSTQHVGKTLASKHPKPRKRIARGFLSVGVMSIAVAFAVAVCVPANVFGSVAPVGASELTAESPGVVDGKQDLAVADSVIAAEAPGERDGYASQSFADAERARYQASGQGFAPGFVPTGGAIRWPFDHSVPLSSGFGYSAEYGGYHSGLDFVPGEGAPISSISDGVVTWVGWDNTGYGYYAKIQFEVDGHQVVAFYGHMIDGSSPMYPGQLIKVGDNVGLTGDTGIAYGAHLHLGIQIGGAFVDPFTWLTEHATDAAADPAATS